MSWQLLRNEAPEHAERVWASLSAQQHTILATLRADGSPRVTGMELDYFEDGLYFGSMPGSWKGRDLERDPRFSLHNGSTPETESTVGDSRISGTARRVLDQAVLQRFGAWMRAEMDFEPPGGFELFGTELTEAVLMRIAGEQLVFDVWRPGRGVRQLRRG